MFTNNHNHWLFQKIVRVNKEIELKKKDFFRIFLRITFQCIYILSYFIHLLLCYYTYQYIDFE